MYSLALASYSSEEMASRNSPITHYTALLIVTYACKAKCHYKLNVIMSPETCGKC